ncbi:MAG: hypothetical protein Q8P93_01250 [bacterium]|nr:hypothetical protein [bacterium]
MKICNVVKPQKTIESIKNAIWRQSHEDIDCDNSYQLVFSQNSSGCTNSAFLFDCRDCHDCFGCVGLRNKQYHIFNKQYTKEEYDEKIKDFDLRSYATLKRVREHFDTFKLTHPRRFARLINTVNSIGDNLQNTKNCKYCFDKRGGVEDTKYAVHGGFGMKDSYDTYGTGICNLFYEAVDAGIGAANNRFVLLCYTCNDISYSYNCYNSSNLFGCIGLRNKEYCILNTQYSKEEYERMVPQIIQSMNESPYTDQHGRTYGFGEFFPAELSPFAYNETIAQEYFPLTSDEAVSKGYAWRDAESNSNVPTLASADIPDDISVVTDDILNQAIECAHAKTCQHLCPGAFRITAFELEFLKDMGIALPRLCPNCRHGERFEARNPVRLWKRTCMCQGVTGGAYTNSTSHAHGTEPCSTTFQTSYSPDRPEIVYCEKCYQSEVV